MSHYNDHTCTRACATCTTDAALTRFCGTEAFKTYVRRAINENSFLNTILEDYRINSIISTKLDNKIPNKVREQIDLQLPSMVCKNIVQQLPNILRNDVTMQTILSKHKTELDIALSQAARTIVERIVSDPQYHEVNKAYFDAFQRNGNKAIRAMEERCSKTTYELRKRLTQTDRLNTKINELETDMSNLKFWLYMSGVGILGISGYIFSKL